MQSKQISLPFFGFGFLEVWSFYMLFSRNLGTGIGSLTWTALSGFVCLATLCIVFLAQRIEALPDHRRIAVVATALNVVGTGCMLYLPQPLDILGLVLASVGNAWLWVMWGDVYCRLDTETAEHSAMGSALLLVLLLIAVMLLSRYVGDVLVLLAAPLSCLFYCLAMGSRPDEIGNSDLSDLYVEKGSRRRAFAEMAIGLGVPIALMYLWWGSPFLGEMQEAAEITNMVIVGLLVFMVLFFALIRFMPTLSVPFICRTELSLVVMGCALACLAGDRFISCVLVFACTIVTAYMSLLYGSRLYRNGFGGAVFTFAAGQLVNHSSGWVGDLLASTLTEAGVLGHGNLPGLWCAVCAVAFFVGTFIQVSESARPVRPESPRPQEDERHDPEARLRELADRYELTPRETEVFLLLAQGRSAPFIRDELVISLNTVTSHMKHIYRKMGLHSRNELLALASQQPVKEDV